MLVRPLLATLLVAGAALAQEKGLHRGTQYPGAAAFPELGNITIVFPAAEGEPVDRNRLSAEARARWLASAFRAKVEVVADDQITESQRLGNLLILGWSNRAWDAIKAERPFERGPQGTTFLGVSEGNLDADLLVFHRNPANWDSFLLFWSRIDPSRDRYQPLPRVGSDWAMYDDYLVIRQGMFKPARTWPPARDPSAEGDHTKNIAERKRRLATLESKSYRVRFDRAAFQEPEVKEILATREQALAKAVAAIGPPPEGFRIDLELYDTAENKKIATGVGDPAHSIPGHREMYLVRPFAKAPSPHEEVHLLAELLYGQCVSSALYEGLALATEGLKPDLTLLFDLPVADSGARTRRRSEGKHKNETADRLDAENAEFHGRVREAYLQLAAAEPDRFRIVESSGSVDDTQTQVRQIVLPFLESRGHVSLADVYEPTR